MLIDTLDKIVRLGLDNTAAKKSLVLTGALNKSPRALYIAGIYLIADDIV
jgi:hypothetical protein